MSETPNKTWQNACVIGLGATGFSCACYLEHLGIRVSVYDSHEKPPFAHRLHQEKPGVETHLGKLEKAEFRDADVLVVSPGVSLTHPSIVMARESGVEIIGDIELFARSVQRPIVGITGSNGKSTVTKLTETLFAAAGISV